MNFHDIYRHISAQNLAVGSIAAGWVQISARSFDQGVSARQTQVA
jgi:hypothetical protein